MDQIVGKAINVSAVHLLVSAKAVKCDTKLASIKLYERVVWNKKI